MAELRVKFLSSTLYPFSSLCYWSCFPSSSVCIKLHEGFSKSTHKPCFLILWKKSFSSFVRDIFHIHFEFSTLSLVLSIVLGVIRKKISWEKNCHSHRSTYTKILLLLRLFSSFELRSLAAIEGRAEQMMIWNIQNMSTSGKMAEKLFPALLFFAFFSLQLLLLVLMYYQKSSWCWRTELYSLYPTREKIGEIFSLGFFSYHSFFFAIFLFLRIFPSVSD